MALRLTSRPTPIKWTVAQLEIRVVPLQEAPPNIVELNENTVFDISHVSEGDPSSTGPKQLRSQLRE
jgi:hypothetical protein